MDLQNEKSVLVIDEQLPIGLMTKERAWVSGACYLWAEEKGQ